MVIGILAVVATGAAVVTGAGAGVLAWMFLRHGRSAADRTAGRVVVVAGCIHAAVPLLAITLRAHHPVAATWVAVASLVASGIVGFVIPGAIFAAAQP